MKRILQINAGSRIYGGVEAFLVNLYREVHDEVQFDFLTIGYSTYDDYIDELTSYGAKLYSLEIDKYNLISKIRVFIKLLLFFKRNKYEYVQVNTGGKFTQIVCLLAAYINGIKHRIAHTHSAGSMTNGVVDGLFSKLIARLATDYFACSKLAASKMFPIKYLDKVIIIHNAIDTDKFRYDESERNALRKKYGLENKIVIGTVGRFHECKNHMFLLDILYELVNRGTEATLVVVGEGETKSSFLFRANEKGIRDRVVLLGQRNDVNLILNMFDFFLLPSFYEGLPVVAVEAQTNDLICILSNKITKEVKLTDRLSFEGIDSDSITKWVDTICKYGNKYERGDNGREEVKKHGYDAKFEADRVKKIYMRL